MEVARRKEQQIWTGVEEDVGLAVAMKRSQGGDDTSARGRGARRPSRIHRRGFLRVSPLFAVF